MHEKLWKKLLDSDNHEDTARRAGCLWKPGVQQFAIKFLNSDYTVDLSTERITDNSNNSTGFLEQLCILAYLIDAEPVEFSGELVKAELLPGGQFFFRGPHCLPDDKVLKAFGRNPELLYSASEELNASKCEFGDASVEVLILPRVSAVFIVWGEDDEFPARSSILFDSEVYRQLPLDALWTSVNLTVRFMLNQK